MCHLSRRVRRLGYIHVKLVSIDVYRITGKFPGIKFSHFFLCDLLEISKKRTMCKKNFNYVLVLIR